MTTIKVNTNDNFELALWNVGFIKNSLGFTEWNEAAVYTVRAAETRRQQRV
jgi:hypothetical protein